MGIKSYIFTHRWNPPPILEMKDLRFPQGLLYAVDKMIPAYPVVGLSKSEWEGIEKDIMEKYRPDTPKVIEDTGDDFFRDMEEYARIEKEGHRLVEATHRHVLERFPWFSVDAGSSVNPLGERWW